MDKKIIRKEYLMKSEKLSKEYLKYSDEKIYENIIKSEDYINAETIFIFVNFKNEINTKSIIEHALKNGKTVGVPLCITKHIMEARKISSLEDLETGYCGILEPKEDCKIIKRKDIDLALIPCVTIDDKCCRVGYGGGFYDRYLHKTKFKKIVLVRKKLLAKNLTFCMNEHDVKCDYIITE